MFALGCNHSKITHPFDYFIWEGEIIFTDFPQSPFIIWRLDNFIVMDFMLSFILPIVTLWLNPRLKVSKLRPAAVGLPQSSMVSQLLKYHWIMILILNFASWIMKLKMKSLINVLMGQTKFSAYHKFYLSV